MRDIFSKEAIKKLSQAIYISKNVCKIAWQADPFLFASYILTSLIPSFFPVTTAYLYKLIIDTVVNIVAGREASYTTLYEYVFISLIFQVVVNSISSINSYVELLFYTKIPIHVNQIVLGKLITLDAQYFEDSDFKNTLEKVRQSAPKPQQTITELVYLGQNMIQVLIGMVAVFHLNWYLTIFIVLTVIPEFFTRLTRSHVSWGMWSANSEIRKRYWYFQELLQSASSITEIKLFSLGKRFLTEMKEIQEKFYKENKTLAKKNEVTDVSLGVFSMLIFAGIQLYVIFQVILRRATIGDIQFYQSVIGQFSGALRGVFRNISNIFENALYVQSIFDVLNAPSLLPHAIPGTTLTATTSPSIEFKDVSFSYPGSKKPILKHMSLVIKPGEKVAFVGENGAGKSTIIRLLARFYDPTSGDILIDGVNLKDITLQSWYDRLGILFQDFSRYQHSVKDNIYFGNIKKTLLMTEIEKAARDGGASEFVKDFSDGYDQMLGRTFEKGEELSTGQWQKIALSRAFFRNASVLILDEPTAAIDARAESEIFERVDTLSRDKTVIIISHRFSTVRHADRIYVVGKGGIVEAGSHQELMKKKGTYANLFTLQAKAYQE
jgi:ATP-binding cassette subfamily B protein